MIEISKIFKQHYGQFFRFGIPLLIWFAQGKSSNLNLRFQQLLLVNCYHLSYLSD